MDNNTTNSSQVSASQAKKKTFGAAHIILLTSSVATFVLALVITGMLLKNDAQNPEKNTIQVAGEGKVEQAPNKAIIRVTAQKDAQTEREAQDMLSQTTAQLRRILTENGIPADQLTTENYSIFETQVQEPFLPASEELSISSSADEPLVSTFPAPPRGRTVKRASHTIKVTVENVDDLEATVNTVARAMTEVESVEFDRIAFELDEDAKMAARDTASAKAVKEAEQKAEGLASAAGRTLGSVLFVGETPANDATGLASLASFAQVVEDSVGVNEDQTQLPAISPEDITIRSVVYMTFKLKR